MNRLLVVITAGIGVLLFVGVSIVFFLNKQSDFRGVQKTVETSTMPITPSSTNTATPFESQKAETKLMEPVQHFQERITKKFFGTYVTPQNSPVQPEKFTGYHTGVDVEYADVQTDVPVVTIADGTVLLARRATGYGGVVAIQHTLNNQPVIGIYGHMNPTTLPKVGQKITAGDKIGLLGKGGSPETDGERKHLHVGLIKGTTVDLKGYVTTKQALTSWIDPLTVL